MSDWFALLTVALAFAAITAANIWTIRWLIRR